MRPLGRNRARPAAEAIRGAVLVETAFALTAVLAMIFGTIEIGMIGGFQLAVDGAAFVAAHEYALGNNSTYKATTAAIFPQVNGSYYIDPNNPTPASVPVNYNTGSTSRAGGASLIEGTNLQATIHTTSPGGFLASSIASLSNLDLHGSFIEPENQVANYQYDVAGAGYAGSSGMTSFFGSAQDVPYNYISQQRMSVCLLAVFSTSCPTSSYFIAAFGTGEYLDQDNWARTNLGVGPYSGPYTFSEMLCHQQVYANLETSLFTMPTTNGALPKQNMLSVESGTVGTNSNAYLVQVYKWGRMAEGGGTNFYYTSASQYGTYPLNPGYGC